VAVTGATTVNKRAARGKKEIKKKDPDEMD
jgi:hypothetical protein